MVKDYVRQGRLRHKEVFVPLAHPPGDASCFSSGTSAESAKALRKRILDSQAFALSRNPRQLFRKTLELPHNRIIARASRRCAFKAATRAGTLRLKQFGKLFAADRGDSDSGAAVARVAVPTSLPHRP